MSGAPVAARTSSSLTPGAHSTRVRPVLEPVLEFVVTLDVVVVVEIVEQLKLFGDLGSGWIAMNPLNTADPGMLPPLAATIAR